MKETTTVDVLVAAQISLRAQWSEAIGSDCSVLAALTNAVILEGGAVWPAYRLLEAVVLPSVDAYKALGDRVAAGEEVDANEFRQLATTAAKCISLSAWLEQPGRTHAEVLNAFNVAILRAKARLTQGAA